MHDVAIVGAGELGGALANALARSDLVGRSARRRDPGLAAGKALDIVQSAAIEGFPRR